MKISLAASHSFRAHIACRAGPRVIARADDRESGYDTCLGICENLVTLAKHRREDSHVADACNSLVPDARNYPVRRGATAGKADGGAIPEIHQCGEQG